MKWMTDGFFQETLLPEETDVKYNEKDWEVKVLVPGVEKRDLKIELIKNVLCVSWKRDKPLFGLQKSGNAFWTVPETVTPEDVSAVCSLGVLTIVVKKPETVVPARHKIAIQ